MIEPQEKKPCPWYAMVHGTAKRCWINPDMKCPDGVRCEPGTLLNTLVVVSK